MAVDGILTSLPGAVAGEAFTKDDLYTPVALMKGAAGAEPYKVVKAGNANAGPLIGVLYTYGPVGLSVQVAIAGIVRFKAGGALAVGDVAGGMDGTAGNASAIVLTPAAAAGEIVETLIR